MICLRKSSPVKKGEAEIHLSADRWNGNQVIQKEAWRIYAFEMKKIHKEQSGIPFLSQ